MQGHTAGHWQSWLANPGDLTPERVSLMTVLPPETGEEDDIECAAPFGYLVSNSEKRKPSQAQELGRNQLDIRKKAVRLSIPIQYYTKAERFLGAQSVVAAF